MTNPYTIDIDIDIERERERMVAISLYRGNLHRVPEVPRKWQSLSPKISLKDFKSLLLRRSSALSRHRFRPILNPNPNSVLKRPKSEPIGIVVKKEETVIKTEGDDSINRSRQLPKVARSLDGKPPEITHVLDELSETEKKKKIIEEKLEVLNAKKHDLVQVLKQILNAEEELKRRSSTRSPIPLQVDVTNDSGSLSRLNTPRLNSDGNLASDIERSETDDISHQIMHSRHLVRPNSISPSSDSLHRRPVFTAVPHPRASLGGIGSPSRFAPLGHLTNLPTAISTSGTSYFMSSPSPAASGTSAFRDNRQPSPWN